MHMHEKNGAFVVQDISTGHLNLSCVSGFICVHLLEPILHIRSAWFSRKVVCCHTCLEESGVASFASQLLAACLLLRAAACSSRDHLLEPR
jgi:hypothetical protein